MRFKDMFTSLEHWFISEFHDIVNELEVLFGQEAPKVLNDIKTFAGKAVVAAAKEPGNGEAKMRKAISLVMEWLPEEAKVVSTDIIKAIVQKQYNKLYHQIPKVENTPVPFVSGSLSPMEQSVPSTAGGVPAETVKPSLLTIPAQTSVPDTSTPE